MICGGHSTPIIAGHVRSRMFACVIAYVYGCALVLQWRHVLFVSTNIELIDHCIISVTSLVSMCIRIIIRCVSIMATLTRTSIVNTIDMYHCCYWYCDL